MSEEKRWDEGMAKKLFEEYGRKGRLTKRQFQKMCFGYGNVVLTNAQLDMAFALIDTNGDGTISFEEFRAFWGNGEVNVFEPLKLPKKVLSSLQIYYSFFEEKDTNQDGVLSKDEFMDLYNVWQDPSATVIPKEEWEKIDLDGNGEISFAEFAAWFAGKMGC